MIKLLRSNSSNPDFQNLVQLLDVDLRKRDGEDHAFYAQFNKIDLINQVIVAYNNDEAIGCGAIKHYDDSTLEIKRMFVKPAHRGNRIASKILLELENWARELGYKKCILETGIKQPEAIRLYSRENYQIISNYGPYVGVNDSRCFEKILV